MTATTGRPTGAGIVEVAAPRLNLAHALSIARAAIAAAERSACVISVAICNMEARIIAFLKMDGTGALSGHEAMRRAIAAAGLGRPSEMVLDDPTNRCYRVSTVENEGIGSSHQRGGLPLIHLGQEFGAVGVCGACDAETDVACARAATLAFQEALAVQETPQDMPPL